MNYKDVLVGTFFGGAITCFVVNAYIRNKYVLIKKLN